MPIIDDITNFILKLFVFTRGLALGSLFTHSFAIIENERKGKAWDFLRSSPSVLVLYSNDELANHLWFAVCLYFSTFGFRFAFDTA